MKNIKVTGFMWAPPFAQGVVRDLRVRWALEEAGLPYEPVLIATDQRNADKNRVWNPFGMVPGFESDGSRLFESGAILHRIARSSERLMPTDLEGQEQTLMWMFAALNTVEPPLIELFALDRIYKGEPWVELRRPGAVETVRKRIEALARCLERRDYLIDRFTVADILMVTVLRFVRDTGLISEAPEVDVYLSRGEARPAFRRALEAQMSEYARHEPIAA